MKKIIKRSGFTIVELVIVIAVIAILASVLVPTFGDVIQKANQSKDIQTVKNMNTALAIYSAAISNEPMLASLIHDINDVMDALNKAGFDTAKELTPLCKGHVFYWYRRLNQIVYVNDDESFFRLVYPKTIPDFPENKDDTLINVAEHAPDAPIVPDQPEVPVSFAGLKVSILGDSISTFSGAYGANYCVYPAGTDVREISDTWWQQVIDTLGMELLVDNAYGGCRILSDEFFNGTGIRNYAAYRDRCVSLHKADENPDVIFVFLGTNDFSYQLNKDNCAKCQGLNNVCADSNCNGSNICSDCRAHSGQGPSYHDYDLGTADSMSKSNIDAGTPVTVCEGYAVILKRMQEAYPDARIYCLSLLPRTSPYQNNAYHDHGQPAAFNAELKAVAEKAGTTFIDLESCVDNASVTWRNYFVDAVHPNAAGMDRITTAVLSAMLNREVYTVSATLSNASLEGSEYVAAGEEYTAMLAPAAGYSGLNVTVMMNGEDITDSVYENGRIMIPSVTGNVKIIASAKGIGWSVGAINSETGTDSYMPSRVVTGFYAVTDETVVSVLCGNAEFCVFYYDSSKNYIKPYDGYTTSSIYVSPSKCAYIRIMARNKGATDAALTADYGNYISISKSLWTVGAINTQDGTIVGASTYPHRIYSDLMDVSAGATVRIGNSDSGAAFCPVFYHADGSYAVAPGNYTTEALTILPGQYAYMRLMVCNLPLKDNKNNHLTAAYGENAVITLGATEITWESGTIHTQTGVNTADSKRIRTDLFNIHSGVIHISADNNTQVNVVYYDKDMKILVNQYSGWAASWSSANAPAGVAYVRVVAKSVPETALTAGYGKNIRVVVG